MDFYACKNWFELDKHSGTRNNNLLPRKKLHTRLKKLGTLFRTARLKNAEAGENGSGFDWDIGFWFVCVYVSLVNNQWLKKQKEKHIFPSGLNSVSTVIFICEQTWDLLLKALSSKACWMTRRNKKSLGWYGWIALAFMVSLYRTLVSSTQV